MRWICKSMATLGPTWPLLFLEPFYGGSHKQLVDLLAESYGGDVFTLPASKWHWRSRVAALSFSHTLPQHHSYKILFCSSVLNLCELVALRPDLASLRKILYFHENQLVYPVRKLQDRDFQHGYNQILSCLVADFVVFNSHFNMNSFLDGIDGHLRLMPDSRPKGLPEIIRPKCCVVYFPLDPPPSHGTSSTCLGERLNDSSCRSAELDCYVEEDIKSNVAVEDSQPLHIVWPHRWEHDKGPEEFCQVLMKLLEAGKRFKVSFLGSHTSDIPECISETRHNLGNRVVHYGPLEREDYWKTLKQADIVVSTAKHEFFGVAMLEAVLAGCFPLCPNKLVYPEFYPRECLYNTEQQLYKKLAGFCDRPWMLKIGKLQMDTERFSWKKLESSYTELLDWTTL